MAPIEVTSEQLPPHATEAEQALLGACITDSPNVLPLASSLLEARDFYHPRNAEIFTALCSFSGRIAPDFVLLCDELVRRGALDRIGGIPYLTRLIQSGALALYVEEYCHSIYTTSFQRAMLTASGRIARIAYEPKNSVQQVLEQSFSEIDQVKTRFAIDRVLRRAGPLPTWKRAEQ